MYDNEHLQRVIDAAKALQEANDADNAATAYLEAAQMASDDAKVEVDRLRSEYNALIGITPTRRVVRR